MAFLPPSSAAVIFVHSVLDGAFECWFVNRWRRIVRRIGKYTRMDGVRRRQVFGRRLLVVAASALIVLLSLCFVTLIFSLVNRLTVRKGHRTVPPQRTAPIACGLCQRRRCCADAKETNDLGKNRTWAGVLGLRQNPDFSGNTCFPDVLIRMSGKSPASRT